MVSLYDTLGVKSTATPEEIEKSYRTLAYKYISTGNPIDLVKLNGAKEILLDTYKRDYYDRFGESQITLLLRPVEGYLYSRYFTRFNIFILFLTAFLILTNLSCLYYFFILFNKNIIRFSLLISSSWILGISLLRSHWALGSIKGVMAPFYSTVINWWLTTIEILTVALYFDNIISSLTSYLSVLFLEIASILYFLIEEKNNYQKNRKSLLFRILKPSILILFYVKYLEIYIMVPAIIAFLYFIVEKRVACVLGFPTLGYSLILYFFSGKSKWYVHPLVGFYILMAVVIMHQLISFFRSNSPITFSDFLRDQHRLPIFNEGKI